MNTSKDPVELSIDELRELTAFAIQCATRVLPIFEAHSTADLRPRQAIEAAQHFVETGKRSNALRMAGLAAYKASRASTTPAAAQAAESATQAVGAAYLHPFSDARQVKHILGSLVHAEYALELDGDAEQAKKFRNEALGQAPAALTNVLKRYPRPTENGHVGDIMRAIDSQLR
jgi:hypothetical protein